MTPTTKLRFIERDSRVNDSGESFLMSSKKRVLQQWWDFSTPGVYGVAPPVNDGEWRDVPMEVE